jgi:hypothetical protein
MTGRRSESGIPRHYGGSKLFGEDNISGVVGRKVMPQFPNPRQHYQMRIAG